MSLDAADTTAAGVEIIGPTGRIVEAVVIMAVAATMAAVSRIAVGAIMAVVATADDGLTVSHDDCHANRFKRRG